jgi:hypothetical protein
MKERREYLLSFKYKFSSNKLNPTIPNAILKISGAGFSYPTSDDTTMASNLDSSRSVSAYPLLTE